MINHNTVLNIPIANGKHLISPDATGTLQIILKIETNEILDFENLALQKDFIHTYCVNEQLDGKIPVLSSLILETVNNDPINNLDFNDWGTSDSVYIQNHIKDTIKYVISGYDDESGVSGIKITETVIKFVNNESPSDAIITETFYENCTFTTETDIHTIYTTYGSHTLKTFNDGIIKLDFNIIDKAGNLSEPKTYYVIKDTQIDTSLLKFSEYTAVQKHESEFESDTRTLTFIEEPKDIFFGSLYTEYSIQMKWGYSLENISNDIQKENGTYTFSHNPNLITYIEITCSDALGNQKKILRAIPPRAFYDISCFPTKENYNSISNLSTIYNIPFNFESLESIARLSGAQLLINSYYYIDKNNEGFKENSKDQAISFGTTKTEFHPIFVFKYPDGSLWYSSLNLSYLEAKSMGSGQTPSRKYVEKNSSNNHIQTPPDIPDTIELSFEPVNNSGCNKVIINTELDSNYTWTYKFINKATNKKSISFTKDCMLPSPATYTLTLIAQDSQNNTYTKENQKMLLQGGTASVEISFDQDLTPPVFDIFSSNSYRLEPNGVTILTKPNDNETGSGIYTIDDKKTIGEITYYLFPNPGLHVSDITNYTLDELEAYQSQAKTIQYNLTKGDIFIPIEDEGFYTLCMVAKDNDGNQHVECIPVFNSYYNSLSSIKLDTETQNISGVSTKYNRIQSTFDITEQNKEKYILSLKYESSTNSWTRTPYNNTGTTGITISTRLGSSSESRYWFKCLHGIKYTTDTLISDTGFYDVKYATPAGSQIKNIIVGEMGIQIIGSGLILAHTFYSPKKLTETKNTEDVQKWLNKGVETGIVIEEEESYIYSNSNYEDIPKGYYYTTIIHGSKDFCIMTDVQQKQ